MGTQHEIPPSDKPPGLPQGAFIIGRHSDFTVLSMSESGRPDEDAWHKDY
jgi:hypothetical protein